MRSYRVPVIGILIAAATLMAGAQTAPSQASPKVAVFFTESLADEKTGVVRLVNAVKGVNAKYKKQSDDLDALRNRIIASEKEITANQSTWQQAMLKDRVEQLDRMKRQYQFDGETAKNEYEKALQTATDPIYQDLSVALMAFAKARGIDLLFDASKFAGTMMVINGSVDITDAFIKDYNAKTTGVPVR